MNYLPELPTQPSEVGPTGRCLGVLVSGTADQ